jgi:hypothetical protein
MDGADQHIGEMDGMVDRALCAQLRRDVPPAEAFAEP